MDNKYLGLARNTVELVEYQIQWKDLFQKESENLTQVLGDIILEIHHIGSTAISDMIAKPIIDILIIVQELPILQNITEVLRELNYE